MWKQAKLDNPDPEKLIPTPLIGFQELSRRMKCQDYETKQHQKRLDVIILLFLNIFSLAFYNKIRYIKIDFSIFKNQNFLSIVMLLLQLFFHN